MSLFALLTCIAWHADAIAAQITLTWVDAATNETGVSMERSIASTGAFSEIDITGPDITTYVDSGLVDDTTYCYRLRAFNDFGYSDYSDAACATTARVFGLVVLKMGAGGGTVTSVPDGISCGPSCSGSYSAGTSVTLNATPAGDSTFAGWSGGGCSGGGACTVTMAGTTTVNATFNSGGSTTSFGDDFERPDSTVLGRGWVEVQGDLGIVTGKLRSSLKKMRHLAVQSSVSLGAGRVAAEFASNDNNHAPAFGLLFGYVNPGNYYAAYRHVGSSSLLKIVRVRSGVETVLAQRSVANPVRGQEFSVAVAFSQSQIVLTAAGVSVSASGVSVTLGNVGLMVGEGTADDFQAGP